MEKIAIGPNLPKNLVDLDFSIEKNILLLADAKNKKPEKLTACILKRPRHDKIIKSLNSLKVGIKFIDDGDVSGVMAVALPKSNIDIFIGTGGGPEGVLAAAALDCLNGQMQSRLVYQNQIEKDRAKKLGITNLSKKYNIQDMVKGDVMFFATGVTDGELVKGVKMKNNSFEVETFVLHKSTNTNKIFKNLVKK